MKQESQVIVDKKATVNLFPDCAHTARHATEVGFESKNAIKLSLVILIYEFLNLRFSTGAKS